MDERRERLAEGADGIAAGAGTTGIFGRSRVLLTAAASLMTAGIVAILLGWLGAAHALMIEQQIPYLISGGLLGVALAIVGAVTFFTHWLTVLIRENREREAARRHDHEEAEAARRRDHAELLAALRALVAPPEPPTTERPLRRAPRRP
jgi:hypothetical protein